MRSSKTPGGSEFYVFLKQNGLSFSCAESCTGGLIASRLTAVSGASEVFWGSAVAYSNEAKQKLLGVTLETLELYGAVSGQTAREMAEGVALLSGSAVSLSVTGIAGPLGGSPEKPVGTVWFGLSSLREGLRKTVSILVHFAGTRSRISG